MKTPYKVIETEPLRSPRAHEIWVRSTDDVHKLAGDILDKLDAHEEVDVACIGAGCTNQALKAIAVVRERLAKDDDDLCAQPFFSSFTDPQKRKRTRMMIRCFVLQLEP